jgi:hypothetical protein
MAREKDGRAKNCGAKRLKWSMVSYFNPIVIYLLDVVGWLLVVDTVDLIFLLGMLNEVSFLCLCMCVFSIFP